MAAIIHKSDLLKQIKEHLHFCFTFSQNPNNHLLTGNSLIRSVKTNQRTNGILFTFSQKPQQSAPN